MPPVVWTGWLPLNQATEGSGRPEIINGNYEIVFDMPVILTETQIL